MFGYPCPHCQQRLLAAPERAGQRTICPKCLKPIVIPKPDQPVPSSVDPDEVPITQMPAGRDVLYDDIMPVMADRLPHRVGANPDRPAAPLPSAASLLFRNEDSLVDYVPPEPHPLPGFHAANAGDTDLTPPPTDAPSVPSSPIVADHVPKTYHNNYPPMAPLPPLSQPDLDLTPPPGPPMSYNPPSSYSPPSSYHPPETSTEPPDFHADEPEGVSHFRPTPSFHANGSGSQPYLPTLPLLPGRLTGDHPEAARNDKSTPSLPELPAHPTTTGNGVVVFNPTRVEAMDIAAELTQAISMRMPPPLEPPSDLRLSTGLWIVLTSVGIGLWLFCMLASMEPLKYVAIIGAASLLIGYVWVAVAAGRRNRRDGLAALLPPVWVYRAANPPTEPGYRPLRFVFAGGVLLVLYALGPVLHPYLYSVAGVTPEPGTPTQDETESLIQRLAEAEQEPESFRLIDVLSRLSTPDVVASRAAADEKPQVITALARLVKCDKPDVRTAALAVFTQWAPNEAKSDVIKAARAENEDERKMAYKLLAQWKDSESAAALVDRLGTDDYQHLIEDSVRAIGLPAAPALVAKLRSGRGLVGLSAGNLLKDLGKPGLPVVQKALAEATTDKEKFLLTQVLEGINQVDEPRFK